MAGSRGGTSFRLQSSEFFIVIYIVAHFCYSRFMKFMQKHNFKLIVGFIFAAASLLAVQAAFVFGEAHVYEKEIKIDYLKAKHNFSLIKESELPIVQLEPEISLVAVGDIMLSRVVGQKIEKNGLDYPFAEMKDFLTKADLAIGNLETAITEGRKVQSGEMMFRSDPPLAETLKEYNFKVLSLANNHSPNFGQEGLKNTFKYLTEAGISYVGAGIDLNEALKPVYWQKNGLKLAFIAFNDVDVVPDSYGASDDWAGTALMNIENIKSVVKEAKANADLVILSMHSGTEYVTKPNDSQINFAHAAVEAGADLIIGHHPHWVQEMEFYQGKYIFYSLGNFIFDQMWSEETRQGLALKVILSKTGVKKIDLAPVYIRDFSQPTLANPEMSEEIKGRLNYNLEDPVFASSD